MSISISAIFLMSVLVLGVLSYPSLLPNLDQDITAFDFQLQLANVAFADDEEEEEEENGSEEEEENGSEEEENGSEEEEENGSEEEDENGSEEEDENGSEEEEENGSEEEKENGSDGGDEEEELEGTIVSISVPNFDLRLLNGTIVTIFTDVDTEFDDFDSLDSILGFGVEVEVVLSNSSLVATEIELEDEEIELEAELVDSDGEDNGKAKFEKRSDRTRLSVEIEDQEQNTTFDVVLSSATIVLSSSTITTDNFGFGDLNLDSRDGDVVPSVSDGDNIEIKKDGIVVLSGTFSPEEEYEEEYEIEVEVKKGKAKIKIELDDEKYRFVLTGNPTDADIISAIVEKTGLDPSFITSIWDYEVEEEDEDMSSITMHEHEDEAIQTALDLIYELQQKIEQLEDRIQTLLEKLDSGEYFGTVPEVDSVIKSYIISFEGSATSIDDESIVDAEGEIFIENLLTINDNISKFRVTGGEISIDNTFYDIVFGKARVSSSSTSGEKDIVVLLGQVIDFADEDDDSSTLKLVINSETSLEGDFGLVPISIEILPQSKIAGQWYLSGSGQLSLLEG